MMFEGSLLLMQSPSWNLVWANPAFLKGLDRWGLPSWFLESMLSCGKVQLWDHWTKWLKICCCSLETMIICAYTYPIVFPVHFRKPSHWYLKIYILFWRLQLWLRAKSTTPSRVDSDRTWLMFCGDSIPESIRVCIRANSFFLTGVSYLFF